MVVGVARDGSLVDALLRLRSAIAPDYEGEGVDVNLIRQARQLVRRRRRAASSPDPPAARVAHPLLEALMGWLRPRLRPCSIGPRT